MRKVIHRITLIDVPTPAWCNSSLYTENGSRYWPKVTCKRCIRAGGEWARTEIKADRAKAAIRRRPHGAATSTAGVSARLAVKSSAGSWATSIW